MFGYPEFGGTTRGREVGAEVLLLVVAVELLSALVLLVVVWVLVVG